MSRALEVEETYTYPTADTLLLSHLYKCNMATHDVHELAIHPFIENLRGPIRVRVRIREESAYDTAKKRAYYASYFIFVRSCTRKEIINHPRGLQLQSNDLIVGNRSLDVFVS